MEEEFLNDRKNFPWAQMHYAEESDCSSGLQGKKTMEGTLDKYTFFTSDIV